MHHLAEKEPRAGSAASDRFAPTQCSTLPAARQWPQPVQNLSAGEFHWFLRAPPRNARARLMGRWSRLVTEAFLDWLNAPKNLRWLDVGCGNGAFSEELITRCAPAAVTAIDPSDDQTWSSRPRAWVRSSAGWCARCRASCP